ncbi:MAG: pyridoxal phosphate-dependent aminotransferase family protein [Deltaproteobacteria bacterium]|jgi:8-amino-7-oxononanoate synthase|nr:pyridoxal phosphate-dependent aminotransferase family protein [Deltaproteobacteria bacterium]
MNEQIPYFLKQHQLMESAPGAETIINGEKHLYFGGTGYYGLHNHPVLIQSAIDALKKYGMSSATSREGYGTTPLILEVEKKAAEYFGTEDASSFASGYLSNTVGLLALLEYEKFDVIFMDESSHYSNKDAVSVTNKPVVTFHHLDSGDLQEKINQKLKPGEKPLIVTDGIFPLFGEIAPIPDYLAVIEQYNGIIWIDDAHAVGVLGPKGRGTKDHYELNSSGIYFGGTFSKAFGSFGGIIPGSIDFIKSVRNVSVWKGANSPPIPATAATIKAIELLMNTPEMRIKLCQNANQLKSGLAKLGFDIAPSNVPIAAWTLKNPEENKKIFNALLKRKIAIQLTKYGDLNTKVLRAVVFSTHSSEQIEKLLHELAKSV